MTLFFFFSTNQTKVQILDWWQTTRAVIVSGVLFSRLSRPPLSRCYMYTFAHLRKKNAWSQVALFGHFYKNKFIIIFLASCTKPEQSGQDSVCSFQPFLVSMVSITRCTGAIHCLEKERHSGTKQYKCQVSADHF